MRVMLLGAGSALVIITGVFKQNKARRAAVPKTAILILLLGPGSFREITWSEWDSWHAP